MRINFRTVIYPYDKVIDSTVEPIIKHLTDATRNYEFIEGALNVSFFREMLPHKGVFMSHGIADKNWRDAPKVYDYDYICVSGPLWRDKMLSQGIPPEKLLINGYPKLDPLFQKQKEKKHKEINLLFAPTHNASDKVSTYKRLLFKLGDLPENINLIDSCHPADDRTNLTFEQYLEADVVISDCSSTIYEAWSLGIPVVFPDWLVKNSVIKKYPSSFEERIYSEGIGFHASDPKEMLNMIYKANEMGMDEKTKAFIEGIFPAELRGSSGEITAKMLSEIAEKG